MPSPLFFLRHIAASTSFNCLAAAATITASISPPIACVHAYAVGGASISHARLFASPRTGRRRASTRLTWDELAQPGPILPRPWCNLATAIGPRPSPPAADATGGRCVEAFFDPSQNNAAHDRLENDHSVRNWRGEVLLPERAQRQPVSKGFISASAGFSPRFFSNGGSSSTCRGALTLYALASSCRSLPACLDNGSGHESFTNSNVLVCGLRFVPGIRRELSSFLRRYPCFSMLRPRSNSVARARPSNGLACRRFLRALSAAWLVKPQPQPLEFREFLTGRCSDGIGRSISFSYSFRSFILQHEIDFLVLAFTPPYGIVVAF